MILRRNTMLMISATLLGLFVVLYFTLANLLLKRFELLEAQEIREQVLWARNIINDDMENLNQTTNDWAGWDDTYQFIQDNNRAYYDNFGDAGITAIKINLMAYFQPSGHLLYGTAFDTVQGRKVPLPPQFLKFMQSRNGRALLRLDAKSSRTGILMLPSSPILLAARPILTNEKRGPVRGTLIFGRYLDTKEMQSISSLMTLPLAISRLDRPPTTPDFATARAQLQNTGPLYSQPLDETYVAGYVTLPDLTGRPAIVLRAITTRDVFHEGRETLRYLLFALLVSYLVFMTAMWLLVETGVLNRLQHLSARVNEIRRSGHIAQRVPVDGRDELSHLMSNINGMLDSLEYGQQQLRHNENLYRQMAMNASDALYSFSLAEASPQPVQWYGPVDELLGYAPGEWPRTVDAWVASLHPEDYQRITAARAAAMRGEQTLHEEYRILCKGGTYRFWLERGQRVQGLDNEEPRFIGACTDITERKLAEMSLEERERLLHATLESTADGILVVDTAGRVAIHNQKFTDMWQISAPLENVPPIESLAPILDQLKDAQTFRNSVRELYAHPETEGSQTIEFTDGRVFECYSPPQALESQKIGRVWSFRDVTASRRAERELRQSEARLREAQHLAHIGDWEWDLKQDKISWSDELYRIYGLSRNEFDGTFESYWQRVHPDDRPMLQAETMRLQEHPGPFETEHRIVRPNGDERFLFSRGEIETDEKGQPLRFYGVIQDITARVQAEKVLRASQEQEKHIAALMRGVLSATHELLSCTNIDEILRRGLEAAREKLGVERCRIALFGRDSKYLSSSYGTNLQGETTDERGHRFERPTWLLEHPEQSEFSRTGWACFDNRPLYEWDGAKMVQIARGWLGATSIQGPNGLRGILFNDTARSGAPVDSIQQEVLAIYCSLLGNIIEHKQTEIQLQQVVSGAQCLLWQADVSRENGAYIWDTNILNGEAAQEFLPVSIPPGGTYTDGFQHAKLAEDQAVMNALSNQALDNGRRRYKQEFRFRTANNEIRWVSEDVRIDPQGKGRWQLTGICTDITDHKELNATRQALLKRLVKAQEEERQRISRELHDVVGQDLAALLLRLKSMPANDQLPPAAMQHLQGVEQLIRHLMQQSRRLALDLRPETLDKLGLPTALRRFTQEWAQHSGVAVDFHSQGFDGHRLSPDMETTVYRVAQEALSNILRHARARQVSVLLERHPTQVVLLVEDDGQGFNVDSALNAPLPERRLGLVGMHERVSLMNGTLKVESNNGQGTIVVARIPIGHTTEEMSISS
jgi:PAS domain S-box-containing protein